MKRDGLLRSERLRGGYTLVEILIVVGILVVLLTMTLMTVRFTRDGDRVTAAAAQIQSFLAGARDRAIYARAPRGVRLFLDTNNPRTVSSMVYIDPSESWSDGVVQLRAGILNWTGGRTLAAGTLTSTRMVWRTIRGTSGWWWEMVQRGGS